MAQFMAPYGGYTYAVLRIMAGLMFAFHGSQKLLGWPLETPAGAPAFVIYLGGSIELVGGLLIAIGLLTRWAAFIASGMMAAAYWMAHGLSHPLPIVNKGELAVLYCFLFLFIASHGPGVWSVDGGRAKT